MEPSCGLRRYSLLLLIESLANLIDQGLLESILWSDYLITPRKRLTKDSRSPLSDSQITMRGATYVRLIVRLKLR